MTCSNDTLYVEIDDELFTFRTFVWRINLHGAINRMAAGLGPVKTGSHELIFRSSILQGVANFVHIYGVFKQQMNNTNTNKPFQNIKN